MHKPSEMCTASRMQDMVQIHKKNTYSRPTLFLKLFTHRARGVKSPRVGAIDNQVHSGSAAEAGALAMVHVERNGLRQPLLGGHSLPSTPRVSLLPQCLQGMRESLRAAGKKFQTACTRQSLRAAGKKFQTVCTRQKLQAACNEIPTIMDACANVEIGGARLSWKRFGVITLAVCICTAAPLFIMRRWIGLLSRATPSESCKMVSPQSNQMEKQSSP